MDMDNTIPEIPEAPVCTPPVVPVNAEPQQVATIIATAFCGAQDFTLKAKNLRVIETFAGVSFNGDAEALSPFLADFGKVWNGTKDRTHIAAHLYQNAKGVHDLPSTIEELSVTAGFKFKINK